MYRIFKCKSLYVCVFQIRCDDVLCDTGTVSSYRTTFIYSEWVTHDETQTRTEGKIQSSDHLSAEVSDDTHFSLFFCVFANITSQLVVFFRNELCGDQRSVKRPQNLTRTPPTYLRFIVLWEEPNMNKLSRFCSIQHVSGRVSDSPSSSTNSLCTVCGERNTVRGFTTICLAFLPASVCRENRSSSVSDIWISIE